MKKFTAILLALVLLCGLSGCQRQEYPAALSYANYTDAAQVFMGALNNDKFTVSSVLHLPIYKFDTLNELNQFKSTFADVFTMDGGWNEVPSFNEQTAGYGDAFFQENTLILVYVQANNSTHRFGVHSVLCEGETFYVRLQETTHAETADDAMAGWFVTLEVPDDIAASCTTFDARLN